MNWQLIFCMVGNWHRMGDVHVLNLIPGLEISSPHLNAQELMQKVMWANQASVLMLESFLPYSDNRISISFGLSYTKITLCSN